MLAIIIPVAVAYQAMDSNKRAKAMEERMRNMDNRKIEESNSASTDGAVGEK
jgi:hypothetical protein